MQQISVEVIKKLPLDDRKSVQQKGDQRSRRVHRAFQEFGSDEEDNGTVEWRENFNNFERYKKRKRQEMLVVDKSTCQFAEGGW